MPWDAKIICMRADRSEDFRDWKAGDVVDVFHAKPGAALTDKCGPANAKIIVTGIPDEIDFRAIKERLTHSALVENNPLGNFRRRSHRIDFDAIAAPQLRNGGRVLAIAWADIDGRGVIDKVLDRALTTADLR